MVLPEVFKQKHTTKWPQEASLFRSPSHRHVERMLSGCSKGVSCRVLCVCAFLEMFGDIGVTYWYWTGVFYYYCNYHWGGHSEDMNDSTGGETGRIQMSHEFKKWPLFELFQSLTITWFEYFWRNFLFKINRTYALSWQQRLPIPARSLPICLTSLVRSSNLTWAARKTSWGSGSGNTLFSVPAFWWKQPDHNTATKHQPFDQLLSSACISQAPKSRRADVGSQSKPPGPSHFMAWRAKMNQHISTPTLGGMINEEQWS